MKTGKPKSKRRFWLKIPANFFEQGPMLLLERSDNYQKLQNVWMRLLTFCLKGNPEEEKAGVLRLSEKFPYDEKTLAAALRVELFDFRVAFKTFLDFEMVEIGPDETIYVEAVQRLIGSETEDAERVRNWRKEKALSAANAVTLLQPGTDQLRPGSELLQPEEKRSDSGLPTPQEGGDPESEKEEFETVYRSIQDQAREYKNKNRRA